MIKFNMTKENVDNLQRIADFAEKRKVIPILAYTQMKLDGQVLQLTSTDHEYACKVDIAVPDADGLDALDVCVEAAVLHKIAKSLQGEDVTIEYIPQAADSDPMLTIKAGADLSKLQTMDSGEYPSLPDEFTEESSMVGVTMITTVADLTSLLGRFHKFAAQNEARLNLSGVCFKEGHIIATDGHRMAYKVDKENVGDDVEAIMPGGFIKKWKTRRKKTDGSVVGLALKKVGTTEYFIIKTGNETCITRKVDAQFPCWQDVVPSGDRESFQFSKNDMADSLKRLSTHLDERYVGVRIKGNTEFPAITVLADNPEMGTRKILMPISKPVDAAFGVNVNYMKDAMSVIESDDVDLYFKDDGSAVELRNADQEDINVIVMPMKV